jgi:hypothetical protein
MDPMDLSAPYRKKSHRKKSRLAKESWKPLHSASSLFKNAFFKFGMTHDPAQDRKRG